MAYKCSNCQNVQDVELDGLSEVHELNSSSDCCGSPDYVEM